MDGYQACLEMRAMEKATASRGRSQIIAVTALGGADEKRRGLVECVHSMKSAQYSLRDTQHQVRYEPMAYEANQQGDDTRSRGGGAADTARPGEGCGHELASSHLCLA